jgi:hypothetical protein
MHAVLTRLKAAPGKLNEVKALAANLITPAYVEHAARGAYILASCDCDELLVLVLYATRAEADDIESSEAIRSLRGCWQDLLVGPPTSEAFDVLVATTGSAPGPPLSGDILTLLADLTRAL